MTNVNNLFLAVENTLTSV